MGSTGHCDIKGQLRRDKRALSLITAVLVCVCGRGKQDERTGNICLRHASGTTVFFTILGAVHKVRHARGGRETKNV